MDYRFENLGPERFQELCQALITRDHPNTQCFPVGQPDGGRDAIYFVDNATNKRKFNVIQIKYVRNPETISDPHKWLTNILKEEVAKVMKLVPKGANNYYIMTNVKGTSHLDVGTIDKVQNILNNSIPIPSQCLWRDDICRRLDNAWDLKWVYPDIMNGVDFIRYIINEGLNSDKERRMDAIKAFIRNQYDLDAKVKFKQVELQNNLTELFVDASLSSNDRINDEQPATNNLSYYQFDSDELVDGAAQSLLNPNFQQEFPFVVIEGGPGQGKSTLSQFVCQVHRIKILGENSKLNKLGEEFKTKSIKIPFKVDLRDFALWLSGKNPFVSSYERLQERIHGQNSLESFLAALVSYHSGGADFKVSDLQAVARISATLILLDGFDEVADIAIRKTLVGEVVSGIHRLKEISASLQVIITSRPTAFANSPGFPEDEFAHFKLDTLNDKLIKDYSEKWLMAKKIYGHEAKEVKQILDEKLTQPHLKDLAKNPMQLAILLTLIHTRGSSLPDKRTALYDSYVDLFFARESEKNAIVREHRDLLIDIHRFIAWTLHSEAEQGSHKGSINLDRLQTLLISYLKSEEQDLTLADKLFTGIVERVVFLVSRVEGTYEFEVQPLREYFAARHLFESAPYSPPGLECNGTRPDRFDAIAKNFYWLNVSRFYAGCYSKGELPSLLDRLQELVKEEGYKYISHPRILASMLLSDWVFTQHPKSMREVVKLILDGLGSKYVISTDNSPGSTGVQLKLPNNCGREQVVEECFNILKSDIARDYAIEIIDILKLNSFKEELIKLWKDAISNTDRSNITKWFEYGLFLDVLSQLSDNDLEELLLLEKDYSNKLLFLLRAGQTTFLEKDIKKCEIIVSNILDGDQRFPMFSQNGSLLEEFANSLSVYKYIRKADNLTFSRKLYYESIEEKMVKPPKDNPLLEKCYELITVVESNMNNPSYEWDSEILPWEDIIEKSRILFGEQWAFYQLANISAGIKLRERYQEHEELLNHKLSLCKRTRHARLKHRAVKWWKQQFDLVNNELDLMFVGLIYLSWANTRTQVLMSSFLNDKFDKLDVKKWNKIIKAAESTVGIYTNKKNPQVDISAIPDSISHRVIVGLSLKLNIEDQVTLYLRYLSDYKGKDLSVLSFCQKVSIYLLTTNSTHWKEMLEFIRYTYVNGISSSLYLTYSQRKNGLPEHISKTILEEPHNFPRNLVILAEDSFRQVIAEKIVPVIEIAQREKWFEAETLTYK